MIEAAIKEKMGPTSGPTESYFSRFGTYFNELDDKDKDDIVRDANIALNLLSVEDGLVKEFRDATRAFLIQFMAKKNSFQRGDYLEFARIVMV